MKVLELVGYHMVECKGAMALLSPMMSDSIIILHLQGVYALCTN